MSCDRPNALNLLEDSGRRIGLRLNVILGHCDPVTELSLRLFPNSPHRARAYPVTLYRSLVGRSHPIRGSASLSREYSYGLHRCRSSYQFLHHLPT